MHVRTCRNRSCKPIQSHGIPTTPGVWRRITASCPDSDEIYITLTNQMTLSLGALNQCRRLRWTIEKARAADRHLPTKLYQALYWPTEVSLQFIPLAYG